LTKSAYFQWNVYKVTLKANLPVQHGSAVDKRQMWKRGTNTLIIIQADYCLFVLPHNCIEQLSMENFPCSWNQSMKCMPISISIMRKVLRQCGLTIAKGIVYLAPELRKPHKFPGSTQFSGWAVDYLHPTTTVPTKLRSGVISRGVKRSAWRLTWKYEKHSKCYAPSQKYHSIDLASRFYIMCIDRAIIGL
jgi:hypothetical protein